ncbi:hypothetical protein F9L33_03320 [Amylibacter sp. SFDW26]|uniref:hypothetical protein n=1 Tax=Amylibacter sp. SFDW26 TaxID=2652722 RepID=UPI001261F0AE|nr:hypothetical protein [Amylibacter sp. SFDW26]KAB7615805.1 hypothetical protein F9L33_03320 [Amylibacter sp. SFDW26]
MSKKSELFFRVRENGAAVFRVDTENRQRRLELKQIAVVNIRNGQVKPQGDQSPTAAERNDIDAWVVDRRKQLAARKVDDIIRAVDHLNDTAQWVQSDATDEQVDLFADDLLMAMHDLRTVLVRKKSNILMKK